MHTMTSREREEYRALRATIRERGTARVWIFVIGIMAWAAMVLATVSVTPELPITALLPLLALAALFEALFALHTGVERIGRYLQSFYEQPDDTSGRRWEHIAMEFGRSRPMALPDPIFSSFFLLATLANFIPASLAGALPVEWAVIGGLHVLFGIRVLVARRRAGGQRAADLARFETLKKAQP